jgi:signal transduction histidine kinase
MQQSARVLPLLRRGGEVCGTVTLIEDVTERVVRTPSCTPADGQQSALGGVRPVGAGRARHRRAVRGRGRPAGRHARDRPRRGAGAAAGRAAGGRGLAGVGWADPALAALFDAASSPRIAAALRADGSAVVGADAADPELTTHGVSGGLVVRVPGRGARPFGLLGAYSRAARHFSPDEVQYAQALADIIGTAAERKRLEAELRVRARELADADRRKDEFLAMLAHELRNPLAPVRNAIEILQATKADDPDVARHADLLARQVGQMAHMVDDLLDVSRLTSGKVTLRPERVALADAVGRAVETARPLIEARRHTLTVELPAAPIVLDADPTRLTQVFGNLLTNAAKYTDEGGRVELSAARDGAEAVVRVRDNGSGLDAGDAAAGVRPVLAGGPCGGPVAGRAGDRADAGAQPGRAARRARSGRTATARGRGASS